MDEQLIERAVEAGAKAHRDSQTRGIVGWDEATEWIRAGHRDQIRVAITAALAEVEADIRADALRDLADHMEKDGLRFIHISVVTDYADTIEQEGKA